MTSIVQDTTKDNQQKAMEKHEKRKQYLREYSKNRRIADPEYRLKQNEATRLNNKKKYDTNPEYRKHQCESQINRYRMYKEAYMQSISTTKN